VYAKGLIDGTNDLVYVVHNILNSFHVLCTRNSLSLLMLVLVFLSAACPFETTELIHYHHLQYMTPLMAYLCLFIQQVGSLLF
jgi:hypothetical protein